MRRFVYSTALGYDHCIVSDFWEALQAWDESQAKNSTSWYLSEHGVGVDIALAGV